MNWEKSKGPALVPEFPPPRELLATEVLRETERYSETDRRMIWWTEALSVAFHRDRLYRFIPGFRFAAYGFFDPDLEQDAFGIAAFVDPASPMEDAVIGELRVGDFVAPVRTRRWIFHPHAFVGPHPLGGTTTCWAECARHDNQMALLTARHVFDDLANLRLAQAKDTVATTQGAATILDVGPGVVDAAVFTSPVSAQPGPRLTVEKYVAQWRDAVFEGGRSGPVSGKVVQVADTRGSFHPHLQAALFLSDPGQAGDSGSLVRYDPSAEGIGLYLGEVIDPTGHAIGFAQNLFQAADSLDLTLYE